MSTFVGRLVGLVCLWKKSQNQGLQLNSSRLNCHIKYMTKIRQGRGKGGEGVGGGKGGGVHRVLDHTYPELSVARATLVLIHLNVQ